jgi:hypothetical protein
MGSFVKSVVLRVEGSTDNLSLYLHSVIIDSGDSLIGWTGKEGIILDYLPR